MAPRTRHLTPLDAVFGVGYDLLSVDGTARAISNSQFLWRAGIVGDLLMQVCDLPVILVFCLLLRPVSESMALVATLINLIQTAVVALNELSLLTPLFLLEDASASRTHVDEVAAWVRA